MAGAAAQRGGDLHKLAARLGFAYRQGKKSLAGLDGARFLSPVADVLDDIGSTLRAYCAGGTDVAMAAARPEVQDEVQLLAAVAARLDAGPGGGRVEGSSDHGTAAGVPEPVGAHEDAGRGHGVFGAAEPERPCWKVGQWSSIGLPVARGALGLGPALVAASRAGGCQEVPAGANVQMASDLELALRARACQQGQLRREAPCFQPLREPALTHCIALPARRDYHWFYPDYRYVVVQVRGDDGGSRDGVDHMAEHDLSRSGVDHGRIYDIELPPIMGNLELDGNMDYVDYIKNPHVKSGGCEPEHDGSCRGEADHDNSFDTKHLPSSSHELVRRGMMAASEQYAAGDFREPLDLVATALECVEADIRSEEMFHELTRTFNVAVSTMLDTDFPA